uniref:Uncharacterized protein n=1 Tax=viral metagenome TaxID=1070528 RepID=A0A6C0CAS9_9ZZZZ
MLLHLIEYGDLADNFMSTLASYLEKMINED